MTIKVNEPALALLQEKMRERMNSLGNHVSDGKCQTIEDYRYVTGQILGAAMAERDLLDIDEMMHRQDDD